jgi:enoyl-CoA hydratase
MNYQNILVETRDRVGLIRLESPAAHERVERRPQRRVVAGARRFDADPGIGAIVITGNDKAFAAGADIGAMAEWDYQKVYRDNYITTAGKRASIRKPVIAAVAGYALGGGASSR